MKILSLHVPMLRTKKANNYEVMFWIFAQNSDKNQNKRAFWATWTLCLTVPLGMTIEYITQRFYHTQLHLMTQKTLTGTGSKRHHALVVSLCSKFQCVSFETTL